MGVALLLGAVNIGARHADLLGALRHDLGGLSASASPYLIALDFGA